MTGNEFHERLDGFYAAGDVAGAYDFLREQRDAAMKSDDKALLLTADNALIGHCRENVRFDEVEGYYREALESIEALGLHGTQAEATTFLNTATAYCGGGMQQPRAAPARPGEAGGSLRLLPKIPGGAAPMRRRGAGNGGDTAEPRLGLPPYIPGADLSGRRPALL